MFVLGTAGHIDHGKSVLIHALTGIDPDRLREEKERGMTIDLGFAWFTLPSGQEVGIVDVPGHEHFIKNMLAGVTAIDLALLVIAGNEGIMPQTKEHLAILDLLGINKGIAAITKKDLVDEELLDLVRMEVEEALGLTTLAGAPIVAVSALTGEGMDELVSAIDLLLSSAEPRKDIGRPRLFVDRVFTVAGAGTVVTGTLIDGSLHVGQEVELAPSGLRSRLRGLQTHKHRIEAATPGSRVAANLAGIPTSSVARGDVLTMPGWLAPTQLVTARLRALPSLRRPLRYGTHVSLHAGSSEAMTTVRLLDRDELAPGESSLVQLKLSEPLAVVKGDRFIVRSPEDTLGGGEIIEPHARRYRRNRPALLESLTVKERGSTEELLTAMLEANQPQQKDRLVADCGLPAHRALASLEGLLEEKKLVAAGSGAHTILFTSQGWQKLLEKATEAVREYHQKHPTREGMPRGELGGRLKLAPAAFTVALQRMLEDRVLVEEGASVRLPTHEIQLTNDQQAKVDAFLQSLARHPYSPPGDNIPEADLLNLLVKQRRVVKVSDNVVFAAHTFDEMVDRIVDHIAANGKITLAETRDMLNTSRKYAQVLLEYLDQKKVTRRVGDERVLGSAAPHR